MQSIQLKTRVNADGILQVQMPPETKNTDLEVMVVFQPLSQQQEQPHYNAWGKPVTRESALGAAQKQVTSSRGLNLRLSKAGTGKLLLRDSLAVISGMEQLRWEISIDKESIPEMIEKGRRF